MDVTYKLIGRKFSELLISEIGTRNIKEAIKRNVAYRKDEVKVCASHDFCDANMVMLDAFRHFLGGEAFPDTDAECGIWGDAWDYACDNDFFLLEA